MKKLSLILILILDAVMASIAQNHGKINGTVSDGSSKESVAFATVVLLNKSAKIKGVTTDFNGYYAFNNLAPGVYEVKVSFVGYRTFHSKSIKIINDTASVKLDIKIHQELNLAEMELVSYDVPLINKSAESKSEILYERSPALGRPKEKIVHQNNGSRPYPHYSLPVETPVYSNESYDKINHNEFQNSKSTPLSTFSIDVDRASYSNSRRFINQGSLPPSDAVRTEELINYFSYDYPNPKGEHPFSVITEVGQCPWNVKNKLVHIGIQGKKIENAELPPTNLVFLIDVSGSMNQENKLPLVKKSLRLLVNQMRRQDRIAMVVYAGAAGLVLESTPGDRKEQILAAIDRLSAGGSTNGAGGIHLAYNVAKENFLRHGNNRVLLATDGDFNVGVSGDSELVALIEGKRNDGIFLTVLGYGMGNYKDSKMEKLADKGNGNYAYIDNLQEANKVLVKEMGGTLFTIAKDVKIQVEFNPAKVRSYRLVGYENRLLADKDFNDDTKDAGELGAGHTVTALYEISFSDDGGENPSIDPLKYQQKSMVESLTNSDELLTVKLRYKEPREDKSKLLSQVLKDNDKGFEKMSDDFRFSAAVAQFGMILSHSKFKGNSTFERTIQIAKNAKGADEDGYRAEFVRIVELANQLNYANKVK